MTIKPFQAQFSLALLSTAAAAVVAYLAVEAFKKLYMVSSEVLAPVAEEAGQALSDVTAVLNGNERIQATAGGFYLNSKYVANDGTLSNMFTESIKAMHPDNAGLLLQIAPYGKLLDKYRYLIDDEVNQAAIDSGQ